MKKHLILMGFMNAGKSFFGKQIAELCEVDYVNLGAEFAKHFRNEKGVVEDPQEYIDLQNKWVISQLPRLEGLEGSVLNVPGKIIHTEDAIEQLRDISLIIHLNCDFDTLYERFPFEQKGNKALLVGAKSYRDLYDMRLPLYARFADETIEETDNPSQDLDRIMQIINRYQLFRKS